MIAEMVGPKLSKEFIIPDSLNRDVSIHISHSLGKLKWSKFIVQIYGHHQRFIIIAEEKLSIWISKSTTVMSY